VENNADTKRDAVSVCVVLDGVLVDIDRGCSGETGVSRLFADGVRILTVLPRRGTQTVKVDVKPGDVIVSNWTGYVDLLYLAFRYAFLSPSMLRCRLCTHR
jgi:hypothetical protein